MRNLPNLDRKGLEERLVVLKPVPHELFGIIQRCPEKDIDQYVAANYKAEAEIADLHQQLKWLDELDNYIEQRLAMRDKVKEEAWFTEAEKL